MIRKRYEVDILEVTGENTDNLCDFVSEILNVATLSMYSTKYQRNCFRREEEKIILQSSTLKLNN